MFKKLSKNEKKGIGYGGFSPILYSIDSVLDILLFAIIFGVGYQAKLSIWQIICYSFITSFFKDFLLYIFMNLKTKTNIIKTIIKISREKKRSFWWTFFGSICGGPLGFTLTTATILYSGAAYGSALSNFSPIIVLLFARIFFKTKLSYISWIGVFLAITGFLGISIYSSFVRGQSFHFNFRIFIGVIIAICAVLTWSVETIVAEYVEKFGKDQSLNNNEKLSIKSIVSSSTNLLIFIPLTLFLSYLSKQDKQTLNMLGKIFSSWQGWLILSSIGLVIVGGRSSYWYAISNIGGGRADILYYLTVLITPLLVLLLFALNVVGFQKPQGVTSWFYWVFLFSQMTGVFLITINSKNNKEHIFVKNKLNIK